MPTGTRYPRCDKCKRMVPQVLDRVVKGKRHRLCFGCARQAGWFDKEPDQGQLFKE